MKILYYNGIIYTGEKIVNSFVIKDNLFYDVKDINDFNKDDYDKCIDLNNKFVCAGFNDSHIHLLGYGQSLLMAKLYEHTNSLKELIEYGKKFLNEHPISEGKWLKGRGFNQDYFIDEKRIPTKDDLDLISKDIPIIFTRACGHCCVINSKGLEICNINKDSKDILGGAIGRDKDGNPNGQFYDNAIDFVHEFIPMPDKEDIKEMILIANKSLNSYGITSCQSDDYCVFNKLNYEIINEAYRELINENKLSIRVYEQSNFTDYDEFKRFIDNGNITGTGDDYFKIGPLKMLGDGSLGSRTACLSKAYHDDPNTRGFNLFTDEHMNKMLEYANNMGMQIAVHAIGDACLDQVLNGIENALNNNPRDNHRHGIVHCQISRADQLERMAKLNLHIYAQSIFLDYDNHIVEARVGKELASTSYNWKTLMNKGLHISNGSDAPVEIPDVLKGIECAITRTSLDGTGPYLIDQAFTTKEALDSFTIEGAYASFEENKKGLIKDGYLADFVILSDNLFEINPYQIHNISILETYIDGKCIYKN